MKRALIVQSPFGAYAAGDLIEDEAEIAAVLAGENSGHVTPISVPAPPAETTEG